MPPFDDMNSDLTGLRLAGGGLLLTENYMLVSMDFGHFALYDVKTKECISKFDPMEQLLWHKSCFNHTSGYFILMIWKGDAEFVWKIQSYTDLILNFCRLSGGDSVSYEYFSLLKQRIEKRHSGLCIASHCLKIGTL